MRLRASLAASAAALALIGWQPVWGAGLNAGAGGDAAVRHAVPAAPVQAPSAETSMPVTYPQTRRDDVVETHFGEKIADAYRWLEEDVRNTPAVADWVARENAVTHAELGKLPGREWFAGKIEQLMAFERFSIPVKAGGQYFYERNSGLQNQAQLFVRKGLKGTPRMLLDPVAWAKDGTSALDTWKPSHEAMNIAGATQERLRLAATMLALAANRTEPNLRADEAVEWALRKRWVGVDGEGRAMIAAAACANTATKAQFPALERIAPASSLNEGRVWGLAIRLARRFSGGTIAALKASALTVEQGELVLSVRDSVAALYTTQAEKDLKALAQTLGLTPTMRVIEADGRALAG